MKRGITREYEERGSVFYGRDGERIKEYEEDLIFWLSIRFTRITEFLSMVIDREIERDEDNDCLELYMAIDFVDGIKRQALDRIEYIYDRLGLDSIDVKQSCNYQPTIILKDEMFDAVMKLRGFFHDNFPNIADGPFPKVVILSGSGPGKESFTKMLIQHCDWVGVPHAVVTGDDKTMADQLAEVRSFRGIIFINVADDAVVPPGVFPWQVIEFHHDMQAGSEPT